MLRESYLGEGDDWKGLAPTPEPYIAFNGSGSDTFFGIYMIFNLSFILTFRYLIRRKARLRERARRRKSLRSLELAYEDGIIAWKESMRQRKLVPLAADNDDPSVRDDATEADDATSAGRMSGEWASPRGSFESDLGSLEEKKRRRASG